MLEADREKIKELSIHSKASTLIVILFLGRREVSKVKMDFHSRAFGASHQDNQRPLCYLHVYDLFLQGTLPQFTEDALARILHVSFHC